MSNRRVILIAIAVALAIGIVILYSLYNIGEAVPGEGESAGQPRTAALAPPTVSSASAGTSVRT
jgi:hypothetical protein